MMKEVLYILVSISISFTAYKTYYDEGDQILGLLLYFLLIAQMIYKPEAYSEKIKSMFSLLLMAIGLFGMIMFFIKLPFFDQFRDILLAGNNFLLGVLLFFHIKK